MSLRVMNANMLGHCSHCPADTLEYHGLSFISWQETTRKLGRVSQSGSVSIMDDCPDRSTFSLLVNQLSGSYTSSPTRSVSSPSSTRGDSD